MQNLGKLAWFSIAFFLAHQACAGSSQGTVSNMIIHSPGIVMFSAGAFSSTASCNTAGQWAISLTDPVGKPMLAEIMSAQAQGKQVFVHGYTNTCRDWADRELPSYIMVY